jgi:hypothetical protein
MIDSCAKWLLLGFSLLAPGLVFAVDPVSKNRNRVAPLTTKELAQWIDDQFGGAWREAKVEPPPVVDDATFMKRVHLDLNGVIPTVSHARVFLDDKDEYKRDLLVDRLLSDARRPEKYAERTAAHWATLWRRMMVPGNSPEARQAVGLEAWLKEQFAANVPYDELARQVITAKTEAQAMLLPNARMAVPNVGPAIFYQVIGGKPETAASSITRVFLGVRIGCAECHNHPFADWKQRDFWGMAAFFAGIRNGVAGDASAKIKPPNSEIEYTATFLGGGEAPLSAGQTPREVLADWLVSPHNNLFAATAVNRVWMYLVGRGLTDSVDDLDRAPPAERRILDGLARLFVDSGYDLRWLMGGICKSRVYQRECVQVDPTDAEPLPGLRVVKTLTPEQVFNSLEQALLLPVSRADGGARFNGLRDQLIARMDEAASTHPDEFRAGIPQALLLMNGRLTAEATNLDQSRTLRGVLDAPFLNTEQKLSTLYLATMSRFPRVDEQQFLLNHVRDQKAGDDQNRAFSEIFWGLLNSPEFVLER